MSLTDRFRPAPPRRRSAATPPDAAEEARALAALAALRGREARRPPPKAAMSAMAVLRPLLKGGALGLNELKRRWPEIVGDKLAKATAPEKLAGGVLTVRTPGAMAPFVQHQIPLILDRCRLAGAEIKSVALLQAAPPPRAKPTVTKPRALTREEEAALAASVAGIEDAALRRALLRLGRAVKAR
ncbi:MAG: DciA family protein [Hyphomonadaceae bacterium]|nr:DciA family protein [Hyphomonadaceae bacterium]